jgi:hypothetical protein
MFKKANRSSKHSSITSAVSFGVEALESRTLMSGGAISGTIYNDLNGNGAIDAGESPLAGRQVYLDLQGIDTLVAGDPVATTSASGTYSFANLPAGNYLVREVPLAGRVTAAPVWGGKFFVQLAAGATAGNLDFIDAPITAPSLKLSNGQTLVAGMGGSPGTVSRFDADSAVDTTYGSLGVLTLPNVSGVATAITSQSDGTILVTFPTQIATLSSTGALISVAPIGTTPTPTPTPAPTPTPTPAPTPVPTSTITVGTNVNTSKVTGSESTGQIAMNPTNPNNLVTVSQSGSNGGSLIPLSRTFDGGKTWTTQLVGAQDGFNAGNPRPDAHIAFDSFGNLYLTYMVAASPTEIRLVVLRSTNGGQTFTSLGAAVSGATFNPDAPWIATGMDATNHAKQHIWISFTDYVSNRVMIVGGVAAGVGKFSGWSVPKTVSRSFGTYSTVAVDAKGELAVSWQSTDTGSVVPNKLMINFDSTGTGSHFSADFLMADTNVGAFDYIAAQPDRSIDAEARIAFDRSGGATNGRLYLVYTNQLIDGTDNTDIYLKYSDNLGSTWSSAVKVNDDTTGNSQFIPAIAVDQTTGNVGISWMDCRNSVTNTGAQLFVTVSLDHGVSVQPNVQVSTGMSYQAGADPNTNDLDFGDSGSLIFNNGKLIPVWSDNSNSTGDNVDGTGTSFDLYTAIILIA